MNSLNAFLVIVLFGLSSLLLALSDISMIFVLLLITIVILIYKDMKEADFIYLQVLLTVLSFRNFFAIILSKIYVSNTFTYFVISGLDFLILGVFFVRLLILRKIRLGWQTIAILSLIIIYWLIGLIKYSNSSFIYLRFFSSWILFYYVGSYLGQRGLKDRAISYYLILSYFIVSLSLLMILFSGFTNILNFESFMEVRGSNLTKTTEFMGIALPRILSPIGHPISFGYYLFSVLMALYLSKKSTLFKFSYGCMLLALIFAAAPKGIFLLLVSLVLFNALLATPARSSKFILSSYILFVGAILIIFGIYLLNTGDNSSVSVKASGFVNGIQNLISKPIGYGLGFGGNLGNTDFTALGDRNYVGFEKEIGGGDSAWGVMFTQLGIIGIVYLLYSLNFGFGELWIAVTKREKTRLILTAAFVLIIFISVFQEESFGGFGLGLIALQLGLITHETPNQPPAKIQTEAE